MKTTKKITRVEDDQTTSTSSENNTTGFTPSAESKAKAKQFRLFAILSWILAIAAEVWAIILLKAAPVNMTGLIILIVVDLIFAVVGSLLWKKANRFDPASEKDKFRFFVQNQLGLIISIIAFLPLIILIFTNKNMNGKQKGIVGSIAVVALVIAGIVGIDFNPPSIEQYEEQTQKVESLTKDGSNHVYWTEYGKSYHIYSDCHHINSKRTDEIFEGTVAKSRELKNITDLCNSCEKRAKKEKGELEGIEKIEEAELPANK